jgi:hypothetical protein
MGQKDSVTRSVRPRCPNPHVGTPLRFTKGQALLLCLRCLLYAPSSPRLTCYAVKGLVATLPAYAPLTAQVSAALVRYEDGSRGQAKREKRGEKRGYRDTRAREEPTVHQLDAPDKFSSSPRPHRPATRKHRCIAGGGPRASNRFHSTTRTSQHFGNG